MSPKPSWSPLTHRVYRSLKAAGVGTVDGRGTPYRAGVAVSGGRDSALLLEVLADLSPALKLELHVVHVHHGAPAMESAVHGGAPVIRAADGEAAPTHDRGHLQTRHRDQAEAFVRARAAHHGLPCHVVHATTGLESEKELRDFRLAAFQDMRARASLDAVFLGHHAQDLLETRLMRLIRGTGGQGLEAMREDERPFLSCMPEELAREAQARDLTWLEDPSNRDSRYLRNWLRHEWLPQLEAKSPGALQSFARSCLNWLDAERAREEPFPGLFLGGGMLSPSLYWRLGAAEQRRALAHLIHELKGADYSRAQLEEIRKRLDKSQNEYRFAVAGLAFHVTQRGIAVARAE